MLVLKSAAFVCLLFAIGDAKFPDIQKKCSIKTENGCFKSYFQNMVKKGISKGFPDLNVPPLDPLKLDNITVNIFKALTGTFSGGSIEGIGKCVYNDFQINLEKKITRQDIICDLTLQGNIKIAGKSSEIEKKFKKDAVKISGKGKMKLDKLNFIFEAPISLIKDNAGDIYLKLDEKNVEYEYDLQDAKFSAENVVIGNEDITKVGVDFLNNNFNWMLKNFGKTFISEGVVIYFGLANKFYSAFPMKYFVLEDLSPYVD